MEFVGPLERVIPNQCAHWCGNLHRIPGSPSSYRPFFCTIFYNLLTKSGASNRGIATPVCELARNDREFDSPTSSNLPFRQNPILCPYLANFPLRSYEKALIMKLYTQRSFGVVWKPWSKPTASAWWKAKRLLKHAGMPLHTDGWDKPSSDFWQTLGGRTQ